MKKLLILPVFLFTFVLGTLAQKDVRSLGAEFIYSTQYEQSGIGVRFQYGVNDQLRLAPSFNYLFENDGKSSAWGLNADIHYLIPVSSELTIYPIGGLGFLSNDYEDGFGLNVGGGLDFTITKELSFYAEAKYGALFSARDQEAIYLGVSYKF